MAEFGMPQEWTSPERPSHLEVWSGDIPTASEPRHRLQDDTRNLFALEFGKLGEQRLDQGRCVHQGTTGPESILENQDFGQLCEFTHATGHSD